MELEINQYLAQQREMAGEQAETRRDRGQDYNWERNQARERRRNRSRPSRFNDVDDRGKQHSGNYDTAEGRRDYRGHESSRRDEDYEDIIHSSRFDDRYDEDSRRYSRSEDRYSSRYDERYNDRRGERGDERRGGRRSERNGNRGDEDDRYGESRERGAAKKEKPSRTVMLKGLNNSVTDHDIRTILQMFGAPIKDVRLVKHRDTGASRGFAFVEFQFLPDAQRWMEENQGLVVLGGQETQLLFSSNKDREEDWFCSQCGTHNFKRRDHCFKCSISKDDSERYSEIGQVASNVLILMGLDALTTEETVTKVLEYTSSAKMNISIARDTLTRTSRGYCYVEMDTVETATHLMNIVASMQPPFQIDGKQVSVHFCKQNIPERPEASVSAVAESQWPAYGSAEQEKTITTPPTVASSAALSYFQHATLDPARLTGAQQTPYAYQQYVVQTGTTLPAQLTYPTQVLLISANAAVAPAGQSAVVMPTDREQYKAAVAQEQVQAARRQQLQQQQLQQQIMATVKLQEEVKKQAEPVAITPAAPTAAAAAAAAAAATAAALEEEQEKLAEQARLWSEKKKEQEVQPEKTSEERKDRAPAITASIKKKKRKKQEVAQDAPVTVQIFQEGLMYPTPDVSTYQYDEQSGFYFDPTIGLYYDASSQYYYNGDTQSYLYWDAGVSTYLPAPDFKPEADQTETGADDKSDKTKDKDKKDKNDKNKMAKKLVKDMARWAKSMNSSKTSLKKSMGGIEGKDWVAGAADAGFAMLMKKANPVDTKVSVQQALQHQISDPGPGSNKSAIVASYGGGSDSDPEPDSNPAFASMNPTAATNNACSVDALTDWSKLICLLCKRQFPSKEILVKHQQFSELHKLNLESLKQQQQHDPGADRDESEIDYQYRDRAQERRSKFGVDTEPPKKRIRPPKPTVPYEQPTKAGLKEDNIGNQMLQKMGWNKGTGLGKKQQGRTDPIEVHKRQAGAGLGTKGGSYDLTATDSYRDAVKKVMRSRFEEME